MLLTISDLIRLFFLVVFFSSSLTMFYIIIAEDIWIDVYWQAITINHQSLFDNTDFIERENKRMRSIRIDKYFGTIRLLLSLSVVRIYRFDKTNKQIFLKRKLFHSRQDIRWHWIDMNTMNLVSFFQFLTNRIFISFENKTKW